MRLSEYSADDRKSLMPYSMEELAIAAIARQREAEKELTDRAFRAGLKSAARWFGELPFGLQMSAGLVTQRLKEMSADVDKLFYEEDDNATDPDSPA